jgi:hypothetical protein
MMNTEAKYTPANLSLQTNFGPNIATTISYLAGFTAHNTYVDLALAKKGAFRIVKKRLDALLGLC